MKIPDKIKFWAVRLRNLFIFGVGIAIIALLFPKEGKFRYEFQKGKPWMHEVLVAPFNFPIYKSEETLKLELDSLLNDFQPFFRLDSTILSSIETDYKIRIFPVAWERYQSSFFVEGNESESTQMKKELEEEENYFYGRIWRITEEIYQRGIVDDPFVLENIINTDNLISVISGQLVESRQSSVVFTQKSAYEDFRKSMEEIALEGRYTNSFISILDPMEMLTPNLIYDEETSELMKNSYGSELSLTSGMVQEGEKVIGLGEPVNEERFRILQSLKNEYETNSGVQRNLVIIVLGQILLASFVYLVFYLFLVSFRSEVLQNGKKTFLLVFLISIMAFLASLAIKSENLNLYVVPFVLLPIIIKTFYDARLALFVHILTILIIGFWAPNGFEFVFMNFIAGMVAIFTLRSVYHRGILFVTAILTLLTYSLVYIGMGIIQEGRIESINWFMFAWFSGNALLILTSYPLIYVFEKSFGFLSDATLFELSDTNQDLLRQLAENAPGTFQHSLQVANLAEEAARVIGANPLLVRAGALYHDIGKMDDPMYFIENIQSEFNPHDNLEFEESARKIISHVSKGVEIGKKKNLPKIILEFIQTHHGTTTVQYFYKSFLKKFPDVKVDVDKFIYPGPKPESREQSILMMADSVEAASRSMKTIDKNLIEELVENIIGNQWKEHQFDLSDLSLKEITTIKEVFKKKLVNIHHARIEYPK